MDLALDPRPTAQAGTSPGRGLQPHVILVDAEGRIVDTWEGGGDAAVWEAMVAKLP
ncbi:MAG TPA: hypothetical protein VI409_04615 [Gaiellaceae bacterium]|nr:hypothetical protein [Gaiellaceae bacterium]